MSCALPCSCFPVCRHGRKARRFEPTRAKGWTSDKCGRHTARLLSIVLDDGPRNAIRLPAPDDIDDTAAEPAARHTRSQNTARETNLSGRFNQKIEFRAAYLKIV